MDKEIVEAVLELIAQGGQGSYSLAYLYIWLYSPVVKGVFFWGGLGILYLILSTAARTVMRGKEEDD